LGTLLAQKANPNKFAMLSVPASAEPNFCKAFGFNLGSLPRHECLGFMGLAPPQTLPMTTIMMNEIAADHKVPLGNGKHFVARQGDPAKLPAGAVGLAFWLEMAEMSHLSHVSAHLSCAFSHNAHIALKGELDEDGNLPRLEIAQRAAKLQELIAMANGSALPTKKLIEIPASWNTMRR
jgi:hypothetical protein